MSEREPETNQRTSIGTYAAFGVVAILVVCLLAAIAVAVTGDDEKTASTPPPTTVTEHPSSAPSAPHSNDETMQGLAAPTVDRLGRRVDVPKWPGGWALPQHPVDRDPYNPAVPVPAPAGMMWQKVNDGAIVPFSTSDGPRYVNGLRAFGFAHTPQGAALAGWQITMRIGATNNETAREIYDKQVIMSDAQRGALYAQLDAEGPYYRGASDAVLSYQSKPDAFRVLDYADDLAVIDYATIAPDAEDGTDQWSTTRLIVSWVDGDWKLTFPEHLGDPTGTATSLDGWTRW